MIGSIARIINESTLRAVRRSFDPYITVKSGQDDPVLVCGIFRSGTSITTRILVEGGLDAGPEKHLLQATGKFSAHNPDGFLENYFFMEMSRYIFHLTNSSGDQPPAPEQVEKINLSAAQDDDFRSYALLELRDERITNRNKADVLKKASLAHPHAYLSHTFGTRPVIKNPHFSVLEALFQKLFPASKRVVVFRRPDDWMRSAKAVTGNAGIELYDRYYQYYLDHSSPNVIFFDYDKLLENPGGSIDKLFHALHIDRGDSRPETLIRKKDTVTAPTDAQSLSVNWNKLLQLAINR